MDPSLQALDLRAPLMFLGVLRPLGGRVFFVSEELFLGRFRRRPFSFRTRLF